MHVLTPHQFQIACREAAGLPRDEIARQLGMTRPAVTKAVGRLRARYGFKTRRELAALLLECDVREYVLGRPRRDGLVRGDPVRTTGGKYPCRDGVYVRANSGTSCWIRIGGAVVCVQAKYIERMEQS